MKFFFNILKSIGFLLLPLTPICGAKAMSQAEAIEFLQEYSKSNRKKLVAIDQQIRDALMSTYNSDLTLKPQAGRSAAYSREIEVLTQKRKEHRLRQDLIDRLTFVIDRKPSRSDWKTFLAKHLLEMASIESTSMSADVGFIKFCSYLSAAIKTIPERSENLLAFIEGYIEFSTILDPKAPSEFIQHRSYTNGTTAVYRKGVSPEEVGDIVEDRLENKAKRSSEDKLILENKTPLLKPVKLSFDASRGTKAKSPLSSKKRGEALQTEASTSLQEGSQTQQVSTMKLKIKMEDIHKQTPSRPSQVPPVAEEEPYN